MHVEKTACFPGQKLTCIPLSENLRLLHVSFWSGANVWSQWPWEMKLKFLDTIIIFTVQPLQIQMHYTNWLTGFNSLAPGRFEWNFRQVIFKLILVIDVCGISCEIAQLSLDLLMTGHQATRHYLSQCWPTTMSPHGITRPQCVNITFVS